MTRAPETLRRAPKLLSLALAGTVLAGCASVDFRQSLDRTNTEASDFTGGKLTLADGTESREALARTAAALLASPLDEAAAVQLALVNDPSLQALLADSRAAAATAAQAGRLPNPLLTFSRMRLGGELDIERTLSIGLLDLLLLPRRTAVAQQRIEQSRLRLSADVIDRVTQVRQAWVNAVGARQMQAYAEQVFDSAEAGAELARRMEAAGNFNKLARARQQVFQAEASTRRSAARHDAVAAKEALVRALGLTDAQAAQLALPDRLPDLPATPRTPDDTAQAARSARLDVRLAQSAVDASARAQGLVTPASVVDIDFGLRRDSRSGPDGSATGHGFEIGARLPLFDWGAFGREAMDAQTRAAADRLEAAIRGAGSSLREDYSAYRTRYDIARHYRDEVVPLRKAISEENLLRYNAMLVGVFELLADSREQAGAVLAAIDAERRFWLADAALRASIVGRPVPAAGGAVTAETGAATPAGGGNAAH